MAAIREDRTRGGRSTYQCTYALPGGSGAGGSGDAPSALKLTSNGNDSNSRSMDGSMGEWSLGAHAPPTPPSHLAAGGGSNMTDPEAPAGGSLPVPQLLLEIMNVEHLWHTNEQVTAKFTLIAAVIHS